MSNANLPVRIEISHLVTGRAHMDSGWDGTRVTTTRLANADPDAGDLDDWGGYEFNGEYAAEFSKRSPREVAEHIIDLQNGAGFSARLLPNSSIE